MCRNGLSGALSGMCERGKWNPHRVNSAQCNRRRDPSKGQNLESSFEKHQMTTISSGLLQLPLGASTTAVVVSKYGAATTRVEFKVHSTAESLRLEEACLDLEVHRDRPDALHLDNLATQVQD